MCSALLHSKHSSTHSLYHGRLLECNNTLPISVQGSYLVNKVKKKIEELIMMHCRSFTNDTLVTCINMYVMHS